MTKGMQYNLFAEQLIVCDGFIGNTEHMVIKHIHGDFTWWELYYFDGKGRMKFISNTSDERQFVSWNNMIN